MVHLHYSPWKPKNTVNFRSMNGKKKHIIACHTISWHSRNGVYIYIIWNTYTCHGRVTWDEMDVGKPVQHMGIQREGGHVESPEWWHTPKSGSFSQVDLGLSRWSNLLWHFVWALTFVFRFFFLLTAETERGSAGRTCKKKLHRYTMFFSLSMFIWVQGLLVGPLKLHIDEQTIRHFNPFPWEPPMTMPGFLHLLIHIFFGPFNVWPSGRFRHRLLGLLGGPFDTHI